MNKFILTLILSSITGACLPAVLSSEVVIPGRKVLRKKFECRHEGLRVITFHPAQKLFVSGSCDGSIKVWEFDEGLLNCVATLNEEQNEPLQSIRSLAIHAEKNLLASASPDGTIRIWDLETFECLSGDEIESIATLICEGNVAPRRLAVDRNKPVCVVGYHDSSIDIWDLEKRECIATFPAHKGPALTLAIHPCGRYLVSSDTDPHFQHFTDMFDCQLSVWDLVTREKMTENEQQEYHEIIDASFNGDGSILVTGDKQGVIIVSEFMKINTLAQMCAIALMCDKKTQSADEHFRLDTEECIALFSDGRTPVNVRELEKFERTFSSISRDEVSRAHAKTRARAKAQAQRKRRQLSKSENGMDVVENDEHRKKRQRVNG